MNWESWKGIQHSMALEGWVISDDELKSMAAEYESTGVASLAEKIVQRSQSSGKPIAEVAKEILSEFRERKVP